MYGRGENFPSFFIQRTRKGGIRLWERAGDFSESRGSENTSPIGYSGNMARHALRFIKNLSEASGCALFTAVDSLTSVAMW